MKNNYHKNYFTTTLTISPLKNATKINEIGLELEKKYNIKFLNSDFKKNNGYKYSVDLSKEYKIYIVKITVVVFFHSKNILIG